jgi:NDP-sugar pyrophosphorylase family protein
VEAVVMAAGEGRRLRPLTERWPKPVLPIDGRPVLATLLRELAAAGCARVTIVTGHLAEQVEALAGDGSAFGIDAAFVRQPSPDGSADTVVRALAAGAEPPLVVAGADTVFAPGDLARFAEAFARSGAAGALAVSRDPPPGARRTPVEVEGGTVVRLVDVEGTTPYGAPPLWGFGEPLRPFLERLSGPPYELGEAYQRAIDGGARVIAVEVGKTRDLTDPADLVHENFPYVERGT